MYLCVHPRVCKQQGSALAVQCSVLLKLKYQGHPTLVSLKEWMGRQES